MGLHLCLVLHLADALAAELEHHSFDYIVAHGVLTLVVQGGLFFCSYNTLPSWQAAEKYQHLAEKEHSCTHPEIKELLSICELY